MKTKLLYLDDAYLRECDARIIYVDKNRIILDKTIFYPTGGGQPHDTGIIKVNEEVYHVIDVRKENNSVVHVLDKEGLKQEEIVHCILDWERRYRLMRMHTAAHILASVFFNEYDAKITGNQLGLDKTRFDFNIPSFDRNQMEQAINRANELMSKHVDLKIYYMSRDDVLKNPNFIKLASKLPPNIDPLRIVEIPGIDIQADGGTHVKNTREIGKIVVLKMENKGKNNRRIYFTLQS